MSALVRLKPYNPRRGFKLLRFTTLKFGKRYVAGKWYLVEDEAELDYLAEVCQNGHTREENAEMGNDAIPAFDIARDKAEAKEIERFERAKERRKEPEGGSIDQPVRVHRPGRKSGDGPRARTRRRVEKTEPRDTEVTPPTGGDTEPMKRDGKELSADELVELRKSEIDAMVESHSADALVDLAEKRGLSKSGNKTELASRIWDHDNGGADVDGDEDFDSDDDE